MGDKKSLSTYRGGKTKDYDPERAARRQLDEARRQARVASCSRHSEYLQPSRTQPLKDYENALFQGYPPTLVVTRLNGVFLPPLCRRSYSTSAADRRILEQETGYGEQSPTVKSSSHDTSTLRRTQSANSIQNSNSLAPNEGISYWPSYFATACRQFSTTTGPLPLPDLFPLQLMPHRQFIQKRNLKSNANDDNKNGHKYHDDETKTRRKQLSFRETSLEEFKKISNIANRKPPPMTELKRPKAEYDPLTMAFQHNCKWDPCSNAAPRMDDVLNWKPIPKRFPVFEQGPSGHVFEPMTGYQELEQSYTKTKCSIKHAGGSKRQFSTLRNEISYSDTLEKVTNCNELNSIHVNTDINIMQKQLPSADIVPNTRVNQMNPCESTLIGQTDYNIPKFHDSIGNNYSINSPKLSNLESKSDSIWHYNLHQGAMRVPERIQRNPIEAIGSLHRRTTKSQPMQYISNNFETSPLNAMRCGRALYHTSRRSMSSCSTCGLKNQSKQLHLVKGYPAHKVDIKCLNMSDNNRMQYTQCSKLPTPVFGMVGGRIIPIESKECSINEPFASFRDERSVHSKLKLQDMGTSFKAGTFLTSIHDESCTLPITFVEAPCRDVECIFDSPEVGNPCAFADNKSFLYTAAKEKGTSNPKCEKKSAKSKDSKSNTKQGKDCKSKDSKDSSGGNGHCDVRKVQVSVTCCPPPKFRAKKPSPESGSGKEACLDKMQDKSKDDQKKVVAKKDDKTAPPTPEKQKKIEPVEKEKPVFDMPKACQVQKPPATKKGPVFLCTTTEGGPVCKEVVRKTKSKTAEEKKDCATSCDISDASKSKPKPAPETECPKSKPPCGKDTSEPVKAETKCSPEPEKCPTGFCKKKAKQASPCPAKAKSEADDKCDAKSKETCPSGFCKKKSSKQASPCPAKAKCEAKSSKETCPSGFCKKKDKQISPCKPKVKCEADDKCDAKGPECKASALNKKETQSGPGKDKKSFSTYSKVRHIQHCDLMTRWRKMSSTVGKQQQRFIHNRYPQSPVSCQTHDCNSISSNLCSCSLSKQPQLASPPTINRGMCSASMKTLANDKVNYIKAKSIQLENRRNKSANKQACPKAKKTGSKIKTCPKISSGSGTKITCKKSKMEGTTCKDVAVKGKTLASCKKPPKSIFQKICDYFKARPGCPDPNDWKIKKLRLKAQKAATKAGLLVCDPCAKKNPCDPSDSIPTLHEVCSKCRNIKCAPPPPRPKSCGGKRKYSTRVETPHTDMHKDASAASLSRRKILNEIRLNDSEYVGKIYRLKLGKIGIRNPMVTMKPTDSAHTFCYMCKFIPKSKVRRTFCSIGSQTTKKHNRLLSTRNKFT